MMLAHRWPELGNSAGQLMRASNTYNVFGTKSLRKRFLVSAQRGASGTEVRPNPVIDTPFGTLLLFWRARERSSVGSAPVQQTHSLTIGVGSLVLQSIAKGSFNIDNVNMVGVGANSRRGKTSDSIRV